MGFPPVFSCKRNSTTRKLAVMARPASGLVVRQFESLFEGGSMAGVTDRQLVEWYTAGRHEPAGEAAFTALVARHGPMVLGVCSQLLGDAQHAEDAFQAVFVVLARKARSIRDPDLLGNWLYGVAIRTARCAGSGSVDGAGGRRQRARSPVRVKARANRSTPRSHRPTGRRSTASRPRPSTVRLTGCRGPSACRWSSVTSRASRSTKPPGAVRCPAGTLRSRLARAREKLKVGLTRRGIALPVAALGAIMAPPTARAAVSPLLCDSTSRAAIRFAAHHTAAVGTPAAPATALAQAVFRTMFVHRIKVIGTSLLTLGRRRHRRRLARPRQGDERRALDTTAPPATRPRLPAPTGLKPR